MRLYRVLRFLAAVVIILFIWIFAIVVQASFTGDCGVRPVCSRWEAGRYLLLFGAVALVLSALVLRRWRKVDQALRANRHATSKTPSD
jgi:hypothetical protein